MPRGTGSRGSRLRPLRRAVPRGVCVLLALALLPAARSLADVVPSTTSEELLVELRAGRLARQTVLARRVDGTILLPCAPLFELLEMDAKSDASGFLEVAGGSGWPRIRIDPTVPEARAGRRPVNPDDLRVEWTGEVLYVGVPALSDLLSTPIQVDLEDLAVTLESVGHLPVGRRAARDRARENWYARQGLVPPDVVLAAEPTVIRGAALDWGVSAPFRGGPEGSSAEYRLGFGADVGGGALDLDYESSERRSGTGDAWSGSWTRAWPDREWMRQARIGTIVGTGPHSRGIRGAAFTNSPYQRRAYFGEMSVTGRVPPAWEVEVWQAGRPVGFVRADDHGFFDAPIALEYGMNVVEIRAYGERGEEAWLSRAVQIDSDRLPFGDFEYQTSFGECESGPCRTQGNLDLRWGVREELTARVGADWFTRRDDTGLFYPYTELVGAFREHWLARVEGVAEAFGTVELGYQPTPGLRTNVIHTVYDTHVESPVIAPQGVASRTGGSLFWRPAASSPSRFVDASFGRIDAFRWRQDRSRLGYHDRLGPVRWTADWQEIRAGDEQPLKQSLLGLAASLTFSKKSRALLDRLHVRGSLAVDVRDGTLDRGGLSLGRSLGPAGRVELSVDWFPELHTPVLSLNLSTQGFGFRSASYVTRSPTGTYSGRTDAEGALVWNDAVGRLEASSLAAPGRGGISGSAFLDEDGDGLLDRDESRLAGVRIAAGDQVVRTDASGRYAIWDLPAFEPAELVVDVAAADNPLLSAAFTRASVAVSPNGYREVNVPLTAGVEVSGRVLRIEAGREAGMGGAPVSLRHVVSGREHTTKTYADGVFYFLSIPPGEYEVTIPRDFLERAELHPEQPGQRYFLTASGRGSGGPAIDVRLVGGEGAR